MELIEETAKDLVGTDEANKVLPRNVIAVGLRACNAGDMNENGAAILELAEALNAPVLTRLDAKGIIDETHPLSFGVIGVHGKPGLESAATIISSADRVIAIGVDDESLLVCNTAGLQIRKVVEIESDSFGLSTRFEAEHTLVGPIASILKDLALCVETKMAVRNRKAKVDAIMKSMTDNDDSGSEPEENDIEKFSYMAHLNPDTVIQSNSLDPPSHRRYMSVPDATSFIKDSQRLWDMLHIGDWTKIYRTQMKIKYSTNLTVSRPGYCHPAAVMGAISRTLRNDSIETSNPSICVDVGDCTLWSSLGLVLRGGSRTLYSEHLGTMGYGLCAGIASILASPAPASAVVLAGDGGFQMTLNELSLFQQMKRPGDKLCIFVFDNSLLDRVAFGFDNAAGCQMVSPDYIKLAEAYNGNGVRLASSDDAEKVVAQALAAEGLFIVHVLVDPTVKADMAAFKDNSLHVMNSG